MRQAQRGLAAPLMPIGSGTAWRTWAVVLVVWLATLAALAGPLLPFEPQTSHVADAVARAPDLDVYLHGQEAQQPDVKPGSREADSVESAHGTATSAEFASISAQDWLDDARETLAIGRRIGERVVMIGTSTGALPLAG
jgi:hypothetical protein